MRRQTTLNLPKYPCSFRVCCCLVTTITDYPQGKNEKWIPAFPQTGKKLIAATAVRPVLATNVRATSEDLYMIIIVI